VAGCCEHGDEPSGAGNFLSIRGTRFVKNCAPCNLLVS
jgi:hypothetical protein